MSIFSKIRVKQALKEIDKKTKVKRYFNFTLGCLLVAIAYNLFLASNDIVSGGIGGIAIILNELIGISNSLVMLIFNISWKIVFLKNYKMVVIMKVQNLECSGMM